MPQKQSLSNPDNQDLSKNGPHVFLIRFFFPAIPFKYQIIPFCRPLIFGE